MISLSVKAAKEGFFDREKVMKALGRAKLRIFKEFGRLVRKRAQASLVYADKPSSPGRPPHAHKSRTITKTSKSTGKSRTRSVSYLREFLFFAYDTSSESVIIGPAKLNSVVSGNALAALEKGGTSTIVSRGKRQNVRITAHPFMRPAMEAELPGLPAMWRDSVK